MTENSPDVKKPTNTPVLTREELELTWEEIEAKAKTLHDEIGNICEEPDCPYCTRYRALLARAEELP